ncbi:hypothetical protein GCK72_002129 [Caenorhabditis remanei]|uniref:Uncharacterized protein n=1 Tax=Caenorhabditis remanei TaxID=31234 RepID=A0A6A5HSW0_CAERE|nr:hypothetical protein GCK72_002129 [Caenorhabditis remanei]KAF1770311.1 hypothetical protein GCK72_002129 [Caenorhabditis remanei]
MSVQFLLLSSRLVEGTAHELVCMANLLVEDISENFSTSFRPFFELTALHIWRFPVEDVNRFDSIVNHSNSTIRLMSVFVAVHIIVTPTVAITFSIVEVVGNVIVVFFLVIVV